MKLSVDVWIAFCFSWLHREATVVSTSEIHSDSESLLAEVILSTPQYERFKAHFGKTRRKTLSVPNTDL